MDEIAKLRNCHAGICESLHAGLLGCKIARQFGTEVDLASVRSYPSSVSAAPVYRQLGVRPVINAAGIYTDLGGSRLSPRVWQAAVESNSRWASMPELLDRSGERIAELLGVEAARVVPGAAAGLALSVAACMTGNDGQWMEQLPDTRGIPRHRVVLQAGHRYKYTRCALMSGAKLLQVGNSEGTSVSELRQGLTGEVACVLHPAHLDGHEATLPLVEVAEIAHSYQIPVVVDAAYMSYPISLIAGYRDQGADLTVFSAKYFWGPNAGGFVYGRSGLIGALAELDFTRFESGQHLIFGRAFKLDRASVVGTTVALTEWCEMDHTTRWASYRERARTIIAHLPALPAHVTPGHFTLDERIIDEPVNAVLVEPDGSCGLTASDLESRLFDGDPRIKAARLGNVLVLCLETIDPGDEQQIVIERVVAAFDA